LSEKKRKKQIEEEDVTEDEDDEEEEDQEEEDNDEDEDERKPKKASKKTTKDGKKTTKQKADGPRRADHKPTPEEIQVACQFLDQLLEDEDLPIPVKVPKEWMPDTSVYGKVSIMLKDM
jgi:hypothetical protein